MTAARELAIIYYETTPEDVTVAWLEAVISGAINRCAEEAEACATKDATGKPCSSCAGAAVRIRALATI